MKVNNFSFMRRVMCIVLFFSLLLSGITVTAIDYNPPRYPKDIKFHTYMKKMVACMTYNWSNVKDEIYRQRLRDAIGDWEWMDNGHVSLSEVSSASNAYLIAYDSWASHLSTTALGVNEATLTKNQNLYNYYLSGS